jgi:hypothetical protein
MIVELFIEPEFGSAAVRLHDSTIQLLVRDNAI